MQQSTLQEVLGVEKELRQRLDAERERVKLWLDAARREIEALHAAELAGLEAAAERRRQEAVLAAGRQAEQVVSDAEAGVRALAALTDDQLRPAIARQLACIIPGARRAR